MPEVGKIIDSLKQVSVGVQTSIDAVKRAREHARQVEQSLGRKGLKRMAQAMGEVVSGLGKVGQVLIAVQETLKQASGEVAAIPADAQADDVLAALEQAGKQIADVPGRAQRITRDVDGLQATVATILKGAQPGPLLGKLEDIKKPLAGIGGSVTTAGQRNSELMADTRAAGGVAAGGAGPVPSSGAGGGRPGERPVVTPLGPRASADFDKFAHSLEINDRTRRIVGSGAEAAFQREHCGETEYRLTPPDELPRAVWSDGLNREYGLAQDAKCVTATGSSFYRPSTLNSEFMRRIAEEKIDHMLLKYRAVIRSDDNPVRGLEIVTNDREAGRHFEARMRALDVPGWVRVEETADD